MALDPREVVSDVATQVRRAVSEPPALLERSPEARPAPPSVAASDEVTAIHRRWAEVHATDRGGADGPAGGGARSPGAVRAKVRARVVTAAGEASRSAQQADRAMIGDVIRAVDALARRADELGSRIADLEALVQEVVQVMSEDVVRLRASLAPGREQVDG